MADAAQLLTGRDVDLVIPAGAILTDAVVLGRIIRPTGDDRGGTDLVIGITAGTSWLDQFGIVATAHAVLAGAIQTASE